MSPHVEQSASWPTALAEEAATALLENGGGLATEAGSDAARIAHSPLVGTLLRLYGGALVIVDRQRRVVAANSTYLEWLGVDLGSFALGRRLGDAMGCVEAARAPGGCGTGAACDACGAARTMVRALGCGQLEQGEACLTVRRGQDDLDVYLRVRAVPIEAEPSLLLFTLTDVTADQRRAALEHNLLYEHANLVTALSAASELIGQGRFDTQELASDVRTIADRFSAELEVQRALLGAKPGAHRLAPLPLRVDDLLRDVQEAVRSRPEARGQTVTVTSELGEAIVVSDRHLLERVLVELALNAVEASPPGEEVRLTAAVEAGGVDFRVWNAGAIPLAVAPRIFRRYFTTKRGAARGHGTFLAKLFGEQVLGGTVGFDSSPERGTEFHLRLPWTGPRVSPPASAA